MIASSYKPIEGESPPVTPTKQPPHRRLLQRIQNIDKTFIVSKLFYFFFYTALGALFPFFSLYYKELWLSASQIGILLALRPTVKLICLPLWKMVTDKYSKPRAVYFISIFGWLIGYYGQTFVSPTNIRCYVYNTHSLMPSAQPNHSLPLNASTVNVPQQDWSLMENSLKSAPLYTKNKVLNNVLQGKRLFKQDTYSVRKMSLKNDKNTRHSTPLQLNEQAIASKQFNFQDKKVRKKSMYKTLHSLDKLYNKDIIDEDKSMYKTLHSLDKLYNNDIIDEDTQLAAFSGYNKQDENNLESKKMTLQGGNGFDSSKNKDALKGTSIQFINSKAHDDSEKMAIIFNEKPSKSPKPDDDFRIQYNYWIVRTLAVLIILTEIITTPTPMLADSAVIQSIANTDNDYGKQRLFGSLGLALAAALVGVWVTYSTNCPFTDTINYIPCFNIFIIGIAATIFVSLFFKFETPRQERDDEFKILEAFKIFKSPRYGFFLFTMFVLGFAHSLQIGFLFWFLQDIGGTPVLFAVIILVHCVSEVIMYFVMGYIIDAIGQQRTLTIAVACYTARFLMYGYLKHPWLVIPMEMLQGMTYGGVWSVAGMYIKAPEGANKLIQSILHGTYWGVGMAIGVLVSGFVIEAYGAQSQFLVMALVMALLLLAHVFVFLGERIEEMDEQEREKRGLAPVDEPPPSKKKGENLENYIGAAAAPLVPCLLYGR